MISLRSRRRVSVDANVLMAAIANRSKVAPLGNHYHFGDRSISCPWGVCRISGIYGVTAGEAKRARLYGLGTASRRPRFIIMEAAS